MIEIYKKLPGTNCGRCGLPTCMAFALKVKKSNSGLSECPFVAEERGSEGQMEAAAPAVSGSEQVSRELEAEAIGADFKAAAEAIGGIYKVEDGREAICLKLISTPYELRKEGLFRDDVYSRDLWARIIICDCVRRRGSRPLTGERLPLGLFPRTASLVKVFQESAEKKIAGCFRRDLNALRERCASLGGAESKGGVEADYNCCFNLLPHVPLYFAFWATDEEFGAECRLLFDSNAGDHIDIEYLAYLVERFAEELTRVDPDGELRPPGTPKKFCNDNMN